MAKSPQELYQEREKRIQDVIELKVPDRIPVVPLDSGFFAKYAALGWDEAMYNMEKAVAAMKKTVTELDFDTFIPPLISTSGPAADQLNLKQLMWAGAALESNRIDSFLYQFVEPGSAYEAMSAEDYDWFLDDPSDYIIRRHWPQIAKGLEPLKNLPPLHDMVSYQVGFGQYLPVFGSPEVVGALEALIRAGQESAEIPAIIVSFIQEMIDTGYPLTGLALCIAPYDYFADYFRGTTGCMIDMYRNPEKLKQAIDRVTPWIIKWGLAQARMFSNLTKRVFIPIHKAAGGFMSEAQHKEFYWPSLRTVYMALIEEGFTPYVYTQGIYTDRLETIRDVPKGKVIYHIESDIFKAKEILGDVACIEGGPSGPMLNTGTPQDIRDYCKKLIDICGKGGGFIMGSELPLITARPENVKAMIDFTKEYGVYK